MRPLVVLLKKQLYFLGLIAVVIPSLAGATEENTIISVNRINIEINRPAQAVWPYILDFRKWEEAKFEYLEGNGINIGDKRIVTLYTDGKVRQKRTEEIIAIENNKRLSLKVHGVPNENNMTVIVDMELLDRGSEKTLFQMDVYIKQDVQADTTLSRKGLIEYKARYEKSLHVFMMNSFLKLKEVVENEVIVLNSRN